MISKGSRNKTKETGFSLIMLSLLVTQINSVGTPFFTKSDTTGPESLPTTASIAKASQIVYIGETGSVKNFAVCPRSQYLKDSTGQFHVYHFQISSANELVSPGAEFDLQGLNFPSGKSRITFGVGHGLTNADDSITGYGISFDGVGVGVNMAGELTEKNVETIIFHASLHPYVQAVRSLGEGHRGVSFGYQSPGVIQTYDSPGDDILQHLAGNSFNSMDVVASKNIEDSNLIYAVDKTGHFRVINIDLLLTGGAKQSLPYIISKEATALSAIDQNSSDFNYFLIGHASGSVGFTLFDVSNEFKIDYPSANDNDDYKIRVLLGKIYHVPESSDLYLALTPPTGHDSFQLIDFDAQPKINLVRANRVEIMVSDITQTVTGGLGGETITNLMIYEAAKSQDTINLKIVTVGYSDPGVSVRLFKFNVDPSAEGVCHSSCLTCITLTSPNACLTCPEGEELTKLTYTSEGTCSVTDNSGPTVFNCDGVIIANCTECHSSSTTSCSKCEDGFGLNAKPSTGGDSCSRCKDSRCHVCNKENIASTCQKCIERLKVSVRTGLCQGDLLKFMNMLILLVFWIFQK